jgi:hypothetical protein
MIVPPIEREGQATSRALAFRELVHRRAHQRRSGENNDPRGPPDAMARDEGLFQMRYASWQ